VVEIRNEIVRKRRLGEEEGKDLWVGVKSCVKKASLIYLRNTEEKKTFSAENKSPSFLTCFEGKGRKLPALGC